MVTHSIPVSPDPDAKATEVPKPGPCVQCGTLTEEHTEPVPGSPSFTRNTGLFYCVNEECSVYKLLQVP